MSVQFLITVPPQFVGQIPPLKMALRFNVLNVMMVSGLIRMDVVQYAIHALKETLFRGHVAVGPTQCALLVLAVSQDKSNLFLVPAPEMSITPRARPKRVISRGVYPVLTTRAQNANGDISFPVMDVLRAPRARMELS